MKRLLAVLVALLMVIAACSPGAPEGEVADEADRANDAANDARDAANDPSAEPEPDGEPTDDETPTDDEDDGPTVVASVMPTVCGDVDGFSVLGDVDCNQSFTLDFLDDGRVRIPLTDPPEGFSTVIELFIGSAYNSEAGFLDSSQFYKVSYESISRVTQSAEETLSTTDENLDTTISPAGVLTTEGPVLFIDPNAVMMGVGFPDDVAAACAIAVGAAPLVFLSIFLITAEAGVDLDQARSTRFAVNFGFNDGQPGLSTFPQSAQPTFDQDPLVGWAGDLTFDVACPDN